MRASLLLAATGFAAFAVTGATAQQAHSSPDQIICAVTNTCDWPPASGDKIKVGNEKAFSLVRSSGTKPTVAPVAPPRAAAARRTAVTTRTAATRPAVRRPATGLDMLVTFESGSAIMTNQAKAEARAFAAAMQSPQLAPMRFAIEGHTDAVGDRDYNRDLSQRRAQSVVDYLVAQGVDGQRLDARGFGFDKPKPGLAPRAPANRRVEFVREG